MPFGRLDKPSFRVRESKSFGLQRVAASQHKLQTLQKYAKIYYVTFTFFIFFSFADLYLYIIYIYIFIYILIQSKAVLQVE